MAESPEFEALSWRDPDGFVVNVQGRILRAVAPEKSEQIRSLIQERWLRRLVEAGDCPRTVEVPSPPHPGRPMEDWLWLEHEALPLPCYPHEITALQLYDSAELTLRIAIDAAQHGWVLKDASAWNVLYSRGRAVFVDLLSFDKQESTGTWIAYGQFARHYLLPLLLYRHTGITPSDVFLSNRDGISPERAYQLLGGLRLVSATAFELIILPKMLARAGSRRIAAEGAGNRKTFGAEIGGRLLLSTLRRLQRTLSRLRPGRSKSGSTWERYEEERDHYSQRDLDAKREFVLKGVKGSRTVLDLGCNAGEYSLLAADHAEAVVAADADHAALSRLYERIRGKGLPITPLAVQIGRPTPAVGWENREVASFLDRTASRFDCILMLGLLHHLLVTERATLPMLAALLHRLNPRTVILEWVDPKDRKFRQLAGLNEALYSHITATQLESCLQDKFRLTEKLHLPCATRSMYIWTR